MLIVFIEWLLAWFGANVSGDGVSTLNGSSLSIWLSSIEIVVFSSMMGYLSFSLDRAESKISRKPTDDWIPAAFTLLYLLVLIAIHFAAWVPVVLVALLASPIILLPPLFHRVTARPPSTPPPFLSIEERCRLHDNLAIPSLPKEFIERYPNASAYVYKKKLPHTAGGLFLHNRNRLPVAAPTDLEITLDCPFTTKTGELAFGREVFRAYLARHKKEGSIVSFLPQENWGDWLTGLEARVWMERIESLDFMPPNHPCLGGLPYQFIGGIGEWQAISLRQ
ncbi:MAG: hypothetical protein AB1656_09720 [Candidatus Omnitrophota bacterium]